MGWMDVFRVVMNNGNVKTEVVIVNLSSFWIFLSWGWSFGSEFIGQSHCWWSFWKIQSLICVLHHNMAIIDHTQTHMDRDPFWVKPRYMAGNFGCKQFQKDVYPCMYGSTTPDVFQSELCIQHPNKGVYYYEGSLLTLRPEWFTQDCYTFFSFSKDDASILFYLYMN